MHGTFDSINPNFREGKNMKPATALIRGILLFVGVLGVCTGLQAQSAMVDYITMKKDLAVFEGIVDTTIRQNLPGNFTLLSSTKGTYLPEFGALFTLEVNLVQLRALTPFDQRPYTQKELDEASSLMVKRLATLKEVLVKVTGEYGASLQQLRADQNLAIVMHIFNPASTGNKDFPSQVIFKIKRSQINQYRENRLSLGDFTRQMEIVQF
jgi:hypothetical protein